VQKQAREWLSIVATVSDPDAQPWALWSSLGRLERLRAVEVWYVHGGRREGCVLDSLALMTHLR